MGSGGWNYSIYYPQTTISILPRWLDCARSIRVPRLVRQMTVLWTTLEKLGHWMNGSILSLTRRKLRLGIFLPLNLCWAEGRIYGIYQFKPKSTFSLWWLDCARPVRTPWQARHKSVLWGLRVKKFTSWTQNPTLFLFWENLVARGSLSDHNVLKQGQKLLQ